MGVLNDFAEKANDVATTAADKARDVATTAADKARDVAKTIQINVKIAGEQKEIDKNCLLIGLWFVTDYEGEIPDGVKDLVDAVNASKAKIAELEASRPVKSEAPVETAEEPAGKPCPICGEVSDSKFCPHCGAPMGDD